MNTCDVEGCDYADTARVDTDSGIPEGTLPDSQGEHQTYRVCPRHVARLWGFIDGFPF